MPFILGEELVNVREAQKNITKYFDKGIVRVTKNGKSLGYLIADHVGILWLPVETIGTRHRRRAEEKNRAHRSPRFPQVHQPRSNLAAFPQKLEGTLKVKCRHGHDRRRRLEWIRAEVAKRIESGSERPIRL